LVWIEIHVAFYAIASGLAHMAQWMFAYEYYNMVRIIPFVLDDVPLPERIVK